MALYNIHKPASNYFNDIGNLVGNFVYFVGWTAIGLLIMCVVRHLGLAVYWGYIDVIRASKHIKKGASKIKVTKVLFIIFWSEFTESLGRSICGTKRIN